MAKKSKIARDRQHREIVARYAERRAELKEIIRTDPQRRAAVRGELPGVSKSSC